MTKTGLFDREEIWHFHIHSMRPKDVLVKSSVAWGSWNSSGMNLFCVLIWRRKSTELLGLFYFTYNSNHKYNLELFSTVQFFPFSKQICIVLPAFLSSPDPIISLKYFWVWLNCLYEQLFLCPRHYLYWFRYIFST